MPSVDDLLEELTKIKHPLLSANVFDSIRWRTEKNARVYLENYLTLIYGFFPRKYSRLPTRKQDF